MSGYTGLLLSRYFSERFQWKFLDEVQHVRAKGSNIEEIKRYSRVRIDKGLDHVPYNFVHTDTGIVIPTPNTMPYEICFITPDEYQTFHEGLLRGGNTANETLESMCRLYGTKVEGFSFRKGKLVFPNGYASLKL